MSTLSLEHLGERVRSRREGLGLTQRQLAVKAGISLRFLAQLEAGQGNISVMRLAEVARALRVPASALLAEAEQGSDATGVGAGPRVALVGLRGAGKSTIGKRLAARLKVPFIELDAAIERAAQLRLAQIFELHGEAYYRRLQREVLRGLVDEHEAFVLATGGSIVSDRDSWRLLREQTTTVWLRARPEDHWNRVVEQGDRRPMAGSPHAFAELRALLAAREPLYATAHHTIDTSTTPIEQTVRLIGERL